VIVEALLIADAATESGGKAHLLGAGITRLTVRSFPWTQPSLSVFVRTRVEEQDVARDHVMGISILSPEGDELSVSPQFGIPAGVIANALGNIYQGEVAAVNALATLNGLIFPREGVYQISVTIDGDAAGETALAVLPEADLPPQIPPT
jgi:hypothetical protein